MRPTTKGVVDVVFCLDASGSMAPCIHGIRRNVRSFLDGLSGPNVRVDCRFEMLAHSCDESNGTFRLQSLRLENLNLVHALYGGNRPAADFWTADPGVLQTALDGVQVYGDEAVVVALDIALDYPWRPRAGCHRVVVLLTDEPMESNAHAQEQRQKVSAVIDKIHALGAVLFLVGPPSPGLSELAEADKSQYQKVAQTQDGLGSLDFAKVLAHIGKSVSVSALQGGAEKPTQRALFDQDRWAVTNNPIRGK